MIWLTYRQHRWEALITLGFVGLLGLVNLVQGIRASILAPSFGIPSCVATSDSGPVCRQAFAEFAREFGWTSVFPVLFVALPALVGPFLAAPLVAREHEFRTSLLVWAQGVTRTRWLLTKVALFAAILCAIAVLMAAVAGVAEQAWSYQRMPWQSSIEWSGPIILGTTLFALALGVFSGALTRRVLAAMLVTLVLVALTRAVVTTQIRPNYLPPVVTSARWLPGEAWVLSATYVDASGSVVPGDRISELQNEYLAAVLFPSRSGGRFVELDQYLAQRGAFYQVRYQPRDRYETIQLIEVSLYSALAVALLGASVWLVRKRPA